jgi:hypothetical protein
VRDRIEEAREDRRGLHERTELEQGDRLEEERDGERCDEHGRRRRTAQRPEERDLHQQGERDHHSEAREDRRPLGPVVLASDRKRVCPRHDQLAVGEVDEAENAEDEADPDRHERVHGSERNRVDRGLQHQPK